MTRRVFDLHVLRLCVRVLSLPFVSDLCYRVLKYLLVYVEIPVRSASACMRSSSACEHVCVCVCLCVCVCVCSQDTSLWFVDLVRLLQSRHDRRQERLETSKQRAMSQLWWPFTQHASLTRDAVQV